MEKQSESFFGILSNIKDSITQISIALGEELLPVAKKTATAIKDTFSVDQIKQWIKDFKIAIASAKLGFKELQIWNLKIPYLLTNIFNIHAKKIKELDDELLEAKKEWNREVTALTRTEEKKRTDFIQLEIKKRAEEEKKRISEIESLTRSTTDVLSEAWKDFYDTQKSLAENYSKSIINILKVTVVKYLQGLQERVVADTAAGIAAAVASKNIGQIAAITAQGAAATTAIQGAIATVQGLKSGGIVTGEGLYRVGEGNRKEAVIPLESVAGRQAITRAMQVSDVTNNITLEIDGIRLAQIMTNKQAQAKRMGMF